MKDFLFSMLSSDGKISSKRLVTFGSFLAIFIGFFCNMIVGWKVDPILLETMQWVVLGGLGFTASEKFSGKSKAPDGEQQV